MEKPIEEGCLVKIVGSNVVPEDTIVEVLFKAPDFKGMSIWIISEQFKNLSGNLTNKIAEKFLRRIDDDDGKELCTSWEDINLISGWVPEHLKEVA